MYTISSLDVKFGCLVLVFLAINANAEVKGLHLRKAVSEAMFPYPSLTDEVWNIRNIA